jgi:16S rRNA (guanine527-N7)-methyltransferase
MIDTITGLEDGLERLQRAAGVELPDDAQSRIARWLDLLIKWNRTYNLTAIRDPERMVTHHVLDALSVLPHLPSRQALRVLDVGSGAGVPGLLLAIARPEWQLALLECNHKKGAFLQQAILQLGLTNVVATTSRVEDYAPAAPFDVVISRAFSDLAAFVGCGARHLAPLGQLIAMKGVYPHEERAELPHTVQVLGTPALAVPGVEAERHLVIMHVSA